MASGVDELVLSSLPLPLARVFRDFDNSIKDGLPKEEEKKKKRSLLGMKQKKKTGALEGWVSELSVIYNMPQEVWQTGEFRWAEIFYQRLICTQSMLEHKYFNLYLDVFTQYEQNNATIKKEKRPRQSRVVCSLRPWLDLHRMDHDNALVGLQPNEQLCEKFTEWLGSLVDLEKQAQELDRTVSAKAASEGAEVDPLLLYSFGYPARRGDLVAAQLQMSDPAVLSFFKSSAVPVLEEFEEEQEAKIVICRICEAIVSPDGKCLRVWVSPREDVLLDVPVRQCIPLRDLVKLVGSGTTNLDLWMGNVKAMRELVQGPFTSFRRVVDKEVTRRAEQFCRAHHVDMELQEIIETAVSSANADPVSFRLYYRVKEELRRLKALPESGIKELADEVQQWGAAKLQRFVTQLNADPDAASNKFFVPTSATDLQQVSTMSFGKLMRDKIESFIAHCERVCEQHQSVKREMLKGNVKNELTRWWLTLIDLECAAFLAAHDYDETAFDEGTYIDGPPRSIQGVKDNLEFVQELLKPEGGRISPEPVVEMLKAQIYEAIDDFVMKAHVVLKEELVAMGCALYGEDPDNSFEGAPLADIRGFLDEKRPVGGEAEQAWLALDGLLKDLQYLQDMKDLEAEQERKKLDPDREVGKLALSYAVPVSGLAMGFFFRLENVLKTVLELWDIPEAPEEGDDAISGPTLVRASVRPEDSSDSDEDAAEAAASVPDADTAGQADDGAVEAEAAAEAAAPPSPVVMVATDSCPRRPQQKKGAARERVASSRRDTVEGSMRPRAVSGTDSGMTSLPAPAAAPSTPPHSSPLSAAAGRDSPPSPAAEDASGAAPPSPESAADGGAADDDARDDTPSRKKKFPAHRPPGKPPAKPPGKPPKKRPPGKPPGRPPSKAKRPGSPAKPPSATPEHDQ